MSTAPLADVPTVLLVIGHALVTTLASTQHSTLLPTPSAAPPLVAAGPNILACNVSAQCVHLKSATCLGEQLPYSSTYLGFANDSAVEEEVHEKLKLWSGLQNVPKCWEVIQPLLCAVYLPRCDSSTNTVELPALELCQITREPCKIVETVQPWPDFLSCDQKHFVKGCRNRVKTVKFNTTGRCMAPLVPTDNRQSWYGDVEGCGIQCQNPLFTDEEHHYVRIFIAVFASLCLLATLFAILTFVVDWRNANRYPALILFYINICFFIGSLGWMAQFLPGARNDIVCRHDGTIREAEPQIGSGETASCSVVFVFVYYFMMGGVTWFLILSYTWHLTFQALGSAKDAIEGKRGTFHLVAWSVPLVLTIGCLAFTQVDGDSVSGICFVGYLHHEYRGGFLLLPISLVVAGGLFFLTRGLAKLIKIRLESPGLISDRASSKIRDTIIRIGIFAGLSFLLTASTCMVHIYIFINEPSWRRAFQDFVICETNRTVARLVSNHTSGACILEDRPSLVATIIHILLFFGAGITMSSWVWTKATGEAWRRFFRRLLKLPTNEPIRLKKHLMIRQAFNKRHDIRRHGRFEFSFHSTHDDPLGMKLDMNSMTSRELSSAWAQAIPRMISRRGAFAHPPKRTRRRYSDSDVHSFQSSVDGPSVESRRYSVETHEHEHQQQCTMAEVEDLRHKNKPASKSKRRGKNRVGPVTTTPPLNKSSKHGGSNTVFFRKTNRIGTGNTGTVTSSGAGGGTPGTSQTPVQLFYRRGSMSGSEASDQNMQVSVDAVTGTGGLTVDYSSDAGSCYRAGSGQYINSSSKRNSLASIELPALTAPPPQYHTVQHQLAVFTTTASAYAGALPGSVLPGAYEVEPTEEPTFTSVTPLDTELMSTPMFKRRTLGRRPSVGSARSVSSGNGHSGYTSHGRSRSSHRSRDRAITRRFVVHTPKAAMNIATVNDSDDCSELSV